MLQAALAGYEKLLGKVDRGERPLHWPREFMAEEKRQKKAVSKLACFRPADTVTFIPATTGGELTILVKQVLVEESKRLNLAIKAVDQGGMSMKRMLTEETSRQGSHVDSLAVHCAGPV